MKAAKPQTMEIPHETLQALIFHKQRTTRREKRLSDIANMKQGLDRDFGGQRKSARVLGRELAALYRTATRIGGIRQAIKILEATKQ
jgi:hypothetical protein